MSLLCWNRCWFKIVACVAALVQIRIRYRLKIIACLTALLHVIAISVPAFAASVQNERDRLNLYRAQLLAQFPITQVNGAQPNVAPSDKAELAKILQSVESQGTGPADNTKLRQKLIDYVPPVDRTPIGGSAWMEKLMASGRGAGFEAGGSPIELAMAKKASPEDASNVSTATGTVAAGAADDLIEWGPGGRGAGEVNPTDGQVRLSQTLMTIGGGLTPSHSVGLSYTTVSLSYEVTAYVNESHNNDVALGWSTNASQHRIVRLARPTASTWDNTYHLVNGKSATPLIYVGKEGQIKKYAIADSGFKRADFYVLKYHRDTVLGNVDRYVAKRVKTLRAGRQVTTLFDYEMVRSAPPPWRPPTAPTGPQPG